MMNMGSWFIATMMSNLKSGEYDSSLCGNWGIVKYPHAEGVERFYSGYHHRSGCNHCK